MMALLIHSRDLQGLEEPLQLLLAQTIGVHKLLEPFSDLLASALRPQALLHADRERLPDELFMLFVHQAFDGNARSVFNDSVLDIDFREEREFSPVKQVRL